jgi:WD40 repeat protein
LTITPETETGRMAGEPTECPKCSRTFQLASDSGQVSCPHCGAELQAEALNETRVLGAAPARRSTRTDPISRKTFANYEIEREIGRGGVGVVYKALDRELRRPVALKVLLSAEHASEDEIKRFYREASSAAMLRHPHIVPIHELKVHAGQHYYTMDFIEGESLDVIIKRRSLKLEESLLILEKVSRALAYAHEQGMVHRDMKPENIIIDRFGEPRVTDFGLVKIIETDEDALTDAGLTRSGAAMGTPFYESPEQAAGQSKAVDGRTDVYALGCILYELITGAPPFVAASAMEILRKQVEEDPIPPSQRGGHAPADVDTICLKCLEKFPERRYQSAADLADDIRHFLDGEPIDARRASMAYVVRRKLLRNKTITAVVSLAVVIVTVLAIWRGQVPLIALGATLIVLVGAWAYIHILRERNEAVRQRDRAVESAERERLSKERVEAERRRTAQVLRSLYFSNIDLARKYVSAGDCSSAEQLLSYCPPDMRHWEWGRINREIHDESARFEGHSGPVGCAVISPDGRLLATGSEDCTARIWELDSGKCLLCLEGHSQEVRGLCFSPDGTRLASAGGPLIRIWDSRSGEKLDELAGHSGRVQALAFSADGRRLASGGIEGTVRIWEASSGRSLIALQGHQTAIRSLAFSPDGTRLASGGHGAGSALHVWDLAAGGDPLVLSGFEGSVFSLGFNDDGSILASADWSGLIKLWSAADGHEIYTLKGHGGPVRDMVFRADGRRLVSASDDRTLRTWDTITGRQLDCFTVKADRVLAFAYLPDARRVVVAATAALTKMWVIGEDRTCRVLRGHLDEIWALCFSPDGSALASGGADQTVRIWEPSSGRQLLSLDGHGAGVRCMSFGGKGWLLASGDEAGTVRLWDHRDGSVVGKLSVGRAVGALAFDPAGARLATSGDDGGIRLWESGSGKQLLQIESGATGITELAFSPDGLSIASSDADGRIGIWDLNSGGRLKSLHGAGGAISDLAFSPCGTRIAAADPDARRVALWDINADEQPSSLEDSSGMVLSLAFSSDGRRLVSGGYASSLKLWDPESGRELMNLPGHNAEIWAVAFSSDGRYLASAGRDQIIRLWLADEWDEAQLDATSETAFLVL